MTARAARLAFGITSAVGAAGLLLQLVLTLTKGGDGLAFQSIAGRVVNYFSYFTIWSNIGAAVTTGLLAVKLERPNVIFRAARLTAVLCTAITGVVFHLALADLQELTGWDKLADFLLHTLVPIACPLGWLLLGPRGQVSRQVLGLSLAGPTVWLGYALIRGALVDDAAGNPYYAYPFMNADIHGYPVALMRCALVAALLAALAAGARALDPRLPGIEGRADLTPPRIAR